ncbi:MAG: chemotaxis response regulator protein-glutamate methylesterase [Leptospirales bacterium]
MTSINVLIVDDSAVVRRTLSEILTGAPGIGSVETAADPIFARRKMDQQWPDVIVLDIEMPRMDGLTFLKEIMRERPTPVLICSSLTQAGAHKSIEALALGAIDTIAKPSVGLKGYLDAARANILNSVKAAGRSGRQAPPGLDADVRARDVRTTPPPAQGAVNERPVGTKHRSPPADVPIRRRGVIAIGASAGGTVALDRVLGRLSKDCPGIVVVQHMPASFTGPFANRLNANCQMEVREAVDGDAVKRGLALIAPGDQHMQLRSAADGYRVVLKGGPPINRHRPSVDVLLRSAAECARADAVGVILTGMGNDGAAGLLEMRTAGAYTITQDEASCAVFGMPREAIRQGAAMTILSLEAIPGELARVNAFA